MPCDQERDLEYLLKREQEKKKKEVILKARQTVISQAKKMGWQLKEVKANSFEAIKPYSKDKIMIEITKNGIIKTITDKISMINHQNAEQFLMNIARDLKAKWKIKHRHGGHTHEHLVSQ